MHRRIEFFMDSAYRYLKYNEAKKPANRNSISKKLLLKRIGGVFVIIALLVALVVFWYSLPA
ncbi:MAG: hypothetical protein LBF84_01480 [Holosporales bacterium]|nr:hypothetical protein [Holosporales bacterium]